jgi:hypothetical protein
LFITAALSLDTKVDEVALKAYGTVAVREVRQAMRNRQEKGQD